LTDNSGLKRERPLAPNAPRSGIAWHVDRQGMFTDRVQLDFGFRLADVAVTNRAETT
jgi:hypothetical protein